MGFGGKSIVGVGGGSFPTEMNSGSIYYGGNGGVQSLDFGFQPDMVWIKNWSGGQDHIIVDSVRGVNSQLSPTTNAAQTTLSNAVTSFDSTGVTLGSNARVNSSGQTYSATAIGASNKIDSNTDGIITSQVCAVPGFSIVKYTGNGISASTVGHGMGLTPQVVLIKRIDGIGDYRGWNLFFLDGITKKRIVLNSTAAQDNLYTLSSVSDTTFGVPAATFQDWNQSGGQYIAYCFSNADGFCKSQIYTGNPNSKNLSFGFNGFLHLVKRIDGVTNWVMYPRSRENGWNFRGLYANTTGGRWNSSSLSGSFDGLGFNFAFGYNNGEVNDPAGTYLSIALGKVL